MSKRKKNRKLQAKIQNQDMRIWTDNETQVIDFVFSVSQTHESEFMKPILLRVE